MSDEVAGRLRERGVPEETIREFLEVLQECDYQRFAPADATEDQMKAFYEKARAAIVRLEKTRLDTP